MQAGYFKHPPLIAWIYELAITIGGSGHVWPIYLAGALANVGAAYACFRLARSFFAESDAFIGGLAVLLLETLAHVVAFEPLSHNTLLATVVAFSCWFAYEALAKGEWKWWLLLGVSLGLGMLTKYDMGIWAVCLLLLVLFSREGRSQLRRPKPYLSALTAVMIMSPNLVWLAQHQFAPFRYAGNRMLVMEGAIGYLTGPLVFLTDQIIWVLCPVVMLAPMLALRNRERSVDEKSGFESQFLGWFTLGPLVIFVIIAIVSASRLRPLWEYPFLSLVPLWLMLAFRRHAEMRSRTRVLATAAILMGIMVVGFVIQPAVCAYATNTPSKSDLPGREMAVKVKQLWDARQPGRRMPYVAGQFFLAQNVSFYLPERPHVFCTQDPSFEKVLPFDVACPWTTPDAVKQQGGIVVWYAERGNSEVPSWIAEVFPHAQYLTTLELPWQTGANLDPVPVGVAYIAPSSN
ncbi:MAG: glycosyltransferase family 39 protein [Acidobacteria bacterium]|nr:glycosyltransferase family 39 protein [Acidobacteriota bacterium]